MPQWIHSRAEHILAKNPSMPKSEAFAIATQQSHAVGKSPKGYGTSEGREKAHEKYKTPGDDKKTANPGRLESKKMASMREELAKIATEKDSGFLDSMKNVLTTPIPGTPELLGGAKAGVEKATRFGSAGGGPSADFMKWQKARAAMGKTAGAVVTISPSGSSSGEKKTEKATDPTTQLVALTPPVLFASPPRGTPVM